MEKKAYSEVMIEVVMFEDVSVLTASAQPEPPTGEPDDLPIQ